MPTAVAPAQNARIVEPVKHRQHQSLQAPARLMPRAAPAADSVARRRDRCGRAGAHRRPAHNRARGRRARCTARHDVFERVRTAGIGIGEDEACSSKPASSPMPNTERCNRMTPRAGCRCAKLCRAEGCGDANTSAKVSQTMPNTAGTCVMFEIHFGRKPSRANSTSADRPYSTQDSPCPCTAGATMTRPRWVTCSRSPWARQNRFEHCLLPVMSIAQELFAAAF
jgi:hypothetical protein